MILPSEVEARAVVPVIRGMVARKLLKDHGLSQQKVAVMLGVTQAAVSNYVREVRGRGISLHDSVEAKRITEEIVDLLIIGVDNITILKKFNDAVVLLKEKRFMCDLHKEMEPELDVTGCHICDSKAD